MEKSKPKSKRGGKRPGAGRKRKETTALREDINAATSAKLVEWLPELFCNLKRLADGGYERIEKKFEPDPKSPKKMILVEKKVSVAEPDRAANQYLIDRLLGKPRQAIELGGEDGGPVRIEVVYEDADPPGEDPEAACGPEEDPSGDGTV